MSSFMHPIGPEPPMVYWLRRLALVLIILTVLALLWWVFSAIRGGGSSNASSSSSSSASASASATATDSASASASPTDTKVVACEASAIKVTAGTDSSTYPVGSDVKVSMTIANVGDVACDRDVGPKANTLEITSGGYHVWSSDDCSPGGKSKVITMQPGDKVSSTVTWNGDLSSEGCPGDEGQAKPGRYELVGKNVDVSSEAVPFAISQQD